MDCKRGVAILASACVAGVAIAYCYGRRRQRRRGSRTGCRHASSAATLDTLSTLKSGIGVDIGGTLSKVIFVHPCGAPANVLVTAETYGQTGRRFPEHEFPCLGGTAHFIKCTTSSLEKAVAGLGLEAGSQDKSNRVVYVTGGGAFKSGARLQEALGVTIEKIDEMDSLVEGLIFLQEHGPVDEVYSLEHIKGRPDVEPKIRRQNWPPTDKPIFLINMGSGVSMVKIQGETFDRVGGTALGGATFWGLARLLTSANTFDEAIELCRKGNNSGVDKLIEDIYGGDYQKYGLSGKLVASCFGKLVAMEDPKNEAKEADVALGLLRLVTIQVALLAWSLAKAHDCLDSVFFVGGFLQGNDLARNLIAYFCSNVGFQAKFLKHCDFVGALGALRADLVNQDVHAMGSLNSRMSFVRNSSFN